MKAKIALLSLISVLASSAQAYLWDGTITETITSSDNAAFQVGQILTGSYSYHSEDINGTFYSTEYSDNWNPSGANSTLAGSVALTLPSGENAFGVTQYPITDTPYVNYLSVVDGKVAGLFWQNQLGFSNPYFNGLSFAFFIGGSQSSLVRGTLAFSDPVDPPETVPDSSATLKLLVLSLGGLVMLRRRFVA